MCRKFFEYSAQRASATCPPEAQKRKAAPDFSARLVRALPQRDDWSFTAERVWTSSESRGADQPLPAPGGAGRG